MLRKSGSKQTEYTNQLSVSADFLINSSGIICWEIFTAEINLYQYKLKISSVV